MQSESMNAIDVAYPNDVELEKKSIDELAHEIDTNYRQAGALASMMIMALVRAGERLLEVKRRVGHGNFQEWCDNNLQCSYRKASRMMKLAKKVNDGKSIFSDFNRFQNIGMSRMWELLDFPEWCVKEIMDSRNITGLTVRDLREELRRIKKGDDKCRTA